MRTTVAIEDELLDRAKDLARNRGTTLGELIEEALRGELGRPSGADTPPEVPVFEGGQGLRPGVDALSNRALLEVLDEGQLIEELR